MKKNKTILLIVVTLLLLLYVFISSVNLNPVYSEGAFFWCVTISIYAAIFLLFDAISFAAGSMFSEKTMLKIDKKVKIPRVKILIIAIPWIAFFIVSLISMPFFNSGAYANQMEEPETADFSSNVQAIDTNSIPIVDKTLAYTIADKKLGEKPSLGSQVVLGDPVIQRVDGKLVWVVPLYHSGFFKWLSNMDGSPGYIVVSATNVRDVTYVDSYNIKYQPNAYFFDSLERKARFSGALFTGITDYSFELDDSGHPYWIITTYNNVWGFSLPEANGVMIMNAATGETAMYDMDNIPSWVDRVQPESFIMEQLANKGEYVHGVFNFSNKDKFETSQGEIIVYNKGKCYLMTGLTSVGSDESAIGFVLVDMVTKKAERYQISGATEYSAQKSAQGKVQDLGYQASFPLILNVSEQPAYFMTLKDNEGLIKQYAYVSVKDYSVVGVGDTVSSALSNYEIALRNTGGSSVDLSNDKQTATGAIVRISPEITDSGTVYRFILDSIPDKLFTAAYDVSPELALTREKDSVSIEYVPQESGVLTVLTFDNLIFTQK